MISLRIGTGYDSVYYSNKYDRHEGKEDKYIDHNPLNSAKLVATLIKS